MRVINLNPTKPINYIKNRMYPAEVVTKETFCDNNKIKESFYELLSVFPSVGLMTATAEPMKEKIWKAFMPIIEVIQGISLPLAFVVMATALCLIIVGQKRQGMNMMKWAVIGFIVMQWLPSFMKILAEVGEAMGQ